MNINTSIDVWKQHIPSSGTSNGWYVWLTVAVSEDGESRSRSRSSWNKHTNGGWVYLSVCKSVLKKGASGITLTQTDIVLAEQESQTEEKTRTTVSKWIQQEHLSSAPHPPPPQVKVPTLTQTSNVSCREPRQHTLWFLTWNETNTNDLTGKSG